MTPTLITLACVLGYIIVGILVYIFTPEEWDGPPAEVGAVFWILVFPIYVLVIMPGEFGFKGLVRLRNKRIAWSAERARRKEEIKNAPYGTVPKPPLVILLKLAGLAATAGFSFACGIAFVYYLIKYIFT